MNKIETTLLELGIPANQLGFRYLADGIRIYLDTGPLYRCQMTTQLYPEVGAAHASTAQRVERAMRHSIETAFEKSRPAALERMFRNSIDPAKGKPTNSAFIATVAMALMEGKTS